VSVRYSEDLIAGRFPHRKHFASPRKHSLASETALRMEPFAHRLVDGAPFSIAPEDRFKHALLLGATGTGKSTALIRLIADSMQSESGAGCLVLDPHGPLAEAALRLVPEHRLNHIAFLSPSDPDWPIGFNVLEDVAPDMRAVAADSMVIAMRGIWHSSWGPRMEDILRLSLEALIEFPGASLIMLPRFLVDAAFRERVLQKTSSPIVQMFFEYEFDTWSDRFREEAISPLLNKVRGFLAVPCVRSVLCQPKSTLHLDHAMAKGRIIIADCGKGRIGASAAHLFGALLLSRTLTHAMERANDTTTEHVPFFVFVDELPAFSSLVLVNFLSEARKAKVGFAGAAQTLASLEDELRAALLGNVQTLVSFRLGAEDAEAMAAELELGSPKAIQDLPFGHAWGRTQSQAFPIELPPPPAPLHDGERARKQSRRHYGRPRETVDRYIREALGLGGAGK
jgi:hypothetical protein